MGLKEKSDSDLLIEIKSLREREKELLSEILQYLLEIETRQLYLGRGFSSMFAFCTEALGYSKDEAYLRIQAMRLIKTVPETEVKIREGSVSLSVAAKVQSAFRQEDKRRKEERRPLLSVSEKKVILKEVESRPIRECERKLAAILPGVEFVPEKTKPLSETHTMIQFTANQSLMEKLERLKGLLAHKNYDGRWDQLISELADLALKKLEPKSRTQAVNEANVVEAGSGEQNRHTVTRLQRGKRRYISVAIRREVFRRAGNCCEYVDTNTERRCASRHALEIDHIQPLALGGDDRIENLRILCDQHNRYLARKMKLFSRSGTNEIRDK